jgi:hypothetical protein
MTGYRQSSFDPNAYEQPGAPLRPFNAFQWLGVAIASLGVLLFLVQIAGRFGWIPDWFGDVSSSAVMLTLIGTLFINSRRERGTQVGSEQLVRNRRILLITVAILAAVLGAALVIQFTGA